MEIMDRLKWLDEYLLRCRNAPQIRQDILDAFNKEHGDDGVSLNTLIRDMEALKKMGADIQKAGREGWYSASAAFCVTDEKSKG